MDFCNKTSMSASEAGRWALLDLISKDNLLSKEHKTLINAKRAVLRMAVFEEMNMRVIDVLNGLKQYKKDLELLRNEGVSKLEVKKFVENKINSFLQFSSNVKETKRLLTRVILTTREIFPFLSLTGSSKLFTVYNNSPLYIYVNNKGILIKKERKKNLIGDGSVVQDRKKDSKKNIRKN